MPEIQPDLSDQSRCISVHWSLPVQCVLPSTHRENWHEAWHPQSGNRIRYRRTLGIYRTEELRDGGGHTLEIPPPDFDTAAIQARVQAAPEGPWFLSDCEGELKIWREAVLRNVTRDETGEITGYRDPAEWRPGDLIAEWDLDTWDPGEDRDDDRIRALAEFITQAPADMRTLLKDVARLQARVDVLTGQVAGRDETIQRVRDLGEMWVGVAGGDSWGRHVLAAIDGDPADDGSQR